MDIHTVYSPMHDDYAMRGLVHLYFEDMLSSRVTQQNVVILVNTHPFFAELYGHTCDILENEYTGTYRGGMPVLTPRAIAYLKDKIYQFIEDNDVHLLKQINDDILRLFKLQVLK